MKRLWNISNFFLFNYPFNIFVYQARMILQNTKEVNSICQNHPIFPAVFIIKVIPTIFISFYINGGTLGAISHTGARQHPDSVLGPLEELVNDKLSGPGVLDLYDCGLAVTAGLGHDEYFVVANDAILFIFWGRLPNYPEGARGFRIGIHHGGWSAGD